MPLKDNLNRRDFLAPAAAGLALTIVPGHVLGGPACYVLRITRP
jgi:hypothetical protein